MSAGAESQTEKKQLKKVFLGGSGMKVSELCLGAMTFGLVNGPSKGMYMPVVGLEESFKILNRFAEVGGSFIDTANIYGLGDSEKVVGQWLATKNREDFEIATKARMQVGPGHNDCGLSRRHLTSSIDTSLKNLQTGFVELFQAHAFDSGTPLEETMRTFNDLVRIGKVRYIGVSNFTGWQLQKVLDLSKSMGIEKFITYQGQYSLLCRDPEYEILPCAAGENVGYLPWSPLKGGWLAGRYKRGAVEAEAGSRVQWAQTVGWKQTNFEELNTEQTWRVLDEVEAIANETGKSMAAVSLRWVMQRPGISSTIIGARTLDQLEQNLDAAWFSLSTEQMDRLNAASALRPIYPHSAGLDYGRNRL